MRSNTATAAVGQGLQRLGTCLTTARRSYRGVSPGCNRIVESAFIRKHAPGVSTSEVTSGMYDERIAGHPRVESRSSLRFTAAAGRSENYRWWARRRKGDDARRDRFPEDEARVSGRRPIEPTINRTSAHGSFQKVFRSPLNFTT